MGFYLTGIETRSADGIDMAPNPISISVFLPFCRGGHADHRGVRFIKYFQEGGVPVGFGFLNGHDFNGSEPTPRFSVRFQFINTDHWQVYLRLSAARFNIRPKGDLVVHIVVSGVEHDGTVTIQRDHLAILDGEPAVALSLFVSVRQSPQHA
jgi:hypothetical protein